MAGLRVFLSSTCYDLNILRSQLRIFIQSLGYEPIMSDYDDVLYDPRIHTHTSCIDEVCNCDMLVLVIGPRFGGKSSPEALNKINFDGLNNSSLNVESLKKKENLSITQLEVLKAIEESIPIYTFIDKKVWHDHELYEKNNDKPYIDEIVFPSIEKQETAKFIFNFINFIRLRIKGNNIFTFEKIQDIQDTLKKQWASYFQKLLNEQRNNQIGVKTELMDPQRFNLEYNVSKFIKENENIKAKKTLKNYYLVLMDFSRNVSKNVDEMSTEEILKYFAYKEDNNLAKSTLETIRITLKSFFEWLVEGKIIPSNPINKIRPFRIPENYIEALTTAELNKIRNACTKPRDRAMIEVLISTGCRLNEMCNLEINNIDWDNNELNISNSSGNRYVLLSPQAKHLLKEYIETRDDKCKEIFVTERKPHRKLSSRAVEVEIWKLANKADLGKSISIRTFRHTFAKSMLAKGCEMNILQILLGNKDYSSTSETYNIKLSADKKKEIYLQYYES